MNHDHTNDNIAERVVRFTCPMHPEVDSATQGMCPECGMNLIPRKSESANETKMPDGHHGHGTAIFKRRFWVSLLLTLPILAYAPIAQTLFGIEAPGGTFGRFLPAVLASVIFFYGGSIFLRSAARELHARMPGMMTLIALAITTAYVYSIAVTIMGGDDTLYWELATLITIMLLGHWIEMRAVSGSQRALHELSKLIPDTALVIRSGEPTEVLISEVKLGDVVLVRPGSRIPVDGIVRKGFSAVDESIVTGESRPVDKDANKRVIAGTTNGDGSLEVEVTEIGERTFLSGVMRLVSAAQASKSRLQLLSDRAAFYLTIIAVTVGGGTFVAWFAAGNTAFAIERMVAVLVIACPHALGLAIPLVASISTTRAAKNGFLVKERRALESARTIDTILFDKTGTLTSGAFGLVSILSAGDSSEASVLAAAAAINMHSEHPIGKAIVQGAKERGIAIGAAENFSRVPGKGTRANIDGGRYAVGNRALLEEMGVSFDVSLTAETAEPERQGKTTVFVAGPKGVMGALVLADIIRPESRDAVRELHEMGIKTAMVTGDSRDVAEWVAREIGIDDYFAEVLPESKSDTVKKLQEQGRSVAMVGDGVNDAPALAQADLGIAIGAGTNVAIESAGIILVRNDPRDIVRIIRLSKLTYRKMIQNLFWAAGYNVAAIPLAAGVLAYRGIVLQPAIAAVLMSLSTVIVAANAVLLRRARI